MRGCSHPSDGGSTQRSFTEFLQCDGAAPSHGIAFAHHIRAARAITDLIGGHLPAYFGPTQELVEAHEAGNIKILATSGAARSHVLSDVPTFREAGYPIEAAIWLGVYGRTPPEVIARLNETHRRRNPNAGNQITHAEFGYEADRHIEHRFCENTAGGFRALGTDHKSFGLQTGSMNFKSTIASTTSAGAIN